MKLSLVATLGLAAQALAQPLSKRRVNATKEAEHDRTSKHGLQTAFGKPYAVFQPQVFVVTMFELEEKVWLDSELGLTQNVTIPGLAPQYPEIHCTANYSLCHLSTGEGEINAAATINALGLSPLFDLSKTYFLLNGIAGGEPEYTTLGSAAFAKYAVQVGLEYQIAYQDFIHTQKNWTSGYFAYGTDNPWEYPQNVYGTEVFELNENLRDRAVHLAETAQLNNGTKRNEKVRQMYKEKAAQKKPSIVKCDIATSDNYYTGNTLGNYFSDYITLLTNGSANYCASAQEDNASLEAFTRLDKHGLVDFDRVVLMRTISDFTRPPPQLANNTLEFFRHFDAGGVSASVDNLLNAGLPFVKDVLNNWHVYADGKKYAADNYTGDILRTLGGKADFGKESFDIA